MKFCVQNHAVLASHVGFGRGRSISLPTFSNQPAGPGGKPQLVEVIGLLLRPAVQAAPINRVHFCYTLPGFFVERYRSDLQCSQQEIEKFEKKM